MPQAAIIKQGTFGVYEYESPKLRLRAEDLDQLVLYYAAPSADAFGKGQSAPAPWGGFEIVDLDCEQDADEWLFQLSCEGLHQVTTRRVRGGYRETNNLGDWDGYEDRWITSGKDRFTKGQRVGNFVCVSTSNVEKLAGVNLWECTGQFVGIRSGIGTRRRTCTSNGQVISGDQLRVLLEGGWSVARKGQASLPKIVVTDVYPSLVPPATNAVPSSRVPPNAPGVRNVSYGGDDRRSVWPKGWSFTCGFDQPFGLSVPLYMVTETFEFNSDLPG